MRSLQLVLVVVLVGVLTTAGGLGASRSLVAGSLPHHEANSWARSLPAGQATKSRATPTVTATNMGIAGIAPEMTSIDWPISSPPVGAGFSHYELDYSFDDVTWNVYKNITSQDTTMLGYTRCPTCAVWWDEFTMDSSPLGGFIESSGQLLDLVQPLNATASFVWSNGTSVWIDWSNPASYGGNVSFVDYELWESVNGSGYTLASSPIYNVSQTSELVSGLSPDTRYSFYIKTLDSLTDPIEGGDYPTNSSPVRFTTPFPLQASAGVNRSTADVGQNLSFECGAVGGIAPYSYGWFFGDGSNASGSAAVHNYSAPGAYTVSCLADDHSDSAVTAQVGVTISADPTVGVPTASPAGSVLAGRSVTFNVSATVGSGGLTYSWAGLPNGCSSANSSTITCHPSGSGTFEVVVTVTDSNGGSARSAALNFTVDPSFLGLPPTEGYLLAGGIAAVALAAALATLLVLRRRKKGGTPPPEPSASPPQALGPSTETHSSSPDGGPSPGAPP